MGTGSSEDFDVVCNGTEEGAVVDRGRFCWLRISESASLSVSDILL